MTVDFIEPQPCDDDQEHPLGADRIAAIATDLPPLTPEMPNAAIPFEAQVADMVQEMLYAIENQLDVVDSQVSAHTDAKRPPRLLDRTASRHLGHRENHPTTRPDVGHGP